MCSRSYIMNCRKLSCYIQQTRSLINFQKGKTHKLYANFYTKTERSALKKYNKFIIPGVAIASTALGYVYYTYKSKETVVDDGKEVSKVFVDPHLDDYLNLLEQYGPIPYLLIGAGTASYAAFTAIRSKDPTSKVLIIGEEQFYPYMRPPLSKEMWFSENPKVAKDLLFKQWNGKERCIFLEEDNFYCNVKDLIENKSGGVSVLRGVKVERIDPVDKIVYLNNGRTITYEKCLLATGGKPKNLPVFENASEDIKKHVTLFRNIEDFQKLDKITRKAKSITIIGGGFLGTELACALGNRMKKFGLEIIQIFPEQGNMAKVLPDYLSDWTTKKVQNEGIKVFSNTTIKNVSKDGNKLQLHLNKGSDILTDHVVVAVGLQPNVELAKVSGLEIDENHNGFLVNAELEARNNLWVAGDAACFYDIKLGRRRVEHHDHAVVSGRLAGENMTGSGKPYWHQSMFWSDLGPEIGYEAIGLTDSSLQTIGIFSKAKASDTPKAVVEATDESIRSEINIQPKLTEMDIETPVLGPPEPGADYQRGIVFYLRNEIIVGMVLWNVFTLIPIARKIINEAKSGDDVTELVKLFVRAEKINNELV